MKSVKLENKFNKLLRDQRGAGMTEYIILVGIVALLSIAAFKFFGTSLTTKVNDQANKISTEIQ